MVVDAGGIECLDGSSSSRLAIRSPSPVQVSSATRRGTPTTCEAEGADVQAQGHADIINQVDALQPVACLARLVAAGRSLHPSQLLLDAVLVGDRGEARMRPLDRWALLLGDGRRWRRGRRRLCWPRRRSRGQPRGVGWHFVVPGQDRRPRRAPTGARGLVGRMLRSQPQVTVVDWRPRRQWISGEAVDAIRRPIDFQDCDRGIVVSPQA